MRHGTGDTAGRSLRLALSAALVLLAPAPAPATVAEDAAPAPATDAGTTVEVFSAVRLLDSSPPPYPYTARLDAREGWVLLNCVVDANGALTDVTIRASTGQPEFEVAAVNWMRRSRFEPPRLGDRTVESSFPYKVTFLMRDAELGARLSFAQHFRRFHDAIEAKDRATAEAELAQLVVKNLYEDAHFHMAQYWHATLWGNDRARIAALRAAIANEKHARYLPRSLFSAAARALFALEIAQSDYGAAMATYELLTPSAQAEPAIARAMATMRTLATDAGSFRVQGEIDARGYWSTWLVKRSFRIEPGTGLVSEFRLRCERRYVIVKLDPELDYTRGPNTGKCEIEVLGARGSTFTLVQL